MNEILHLRSPTCLLKTISRPQRKQGRNTTNCHSVLSLFPIWVFCEGYEDIICDEIHLLKMQCGTILLFKIFLHFKILFIFRERGREGEKWKETSMCKG